jgi:hypothetical protein
MNIPDTHPLGIIQIQQDGQLDVASITGTATSGPSGYLSGDFYGTDGSVVAGFFGQDGPNNENLSGAYIVSRD